MARPSEPLLERLRQLVDARGLTPASLAQQTGLERERVRRVLGGQEPMTIDEFLLLSEALELSPHDLGLPGIDVGDLPYEPPGPDAPHALDDDDLGETLVIEDVVDPYGNHVRQLFEVGFALACDFFFFAETEELDGSGIPEHVLGEYEGGQIPLRLDAAFHADHEPRFEHAGIRLRVGFDALYDCFFPWTAIRRVMFLPAMPVLDEDEDTPEEEPPAKGAPFLRLVE